jgi:hypothetical protein
MAPQSGVDAHVHSPGTRASAGCACRRPPACQVASAPATSRHPKSAARQLSPARPQAAPGGTPRFPFPAGSGSDRGFPGSHSRFRLPVDHREPHAGFPLSSPDFPGGARWPGGSTTSTCLYLTVPLPVPQPECAHGRGATVVVSGRGCPSRPTWPQRRSSSSALYQSVLFCSQVPDSLFVN